MSYSSDFTLRIFRNLLFSFKQLFLQSSVFERVLFSMWCAKVVSFKKEAVAATSRCYFNKLLIEFSKSKEKKSKHEFPAFKKLAESKIEPRKFLNLSRDFHLPRQGARVNQLRISRIPTNFIISNNSLRKVRRQLKLFPFQVSDRTSWLEVVRRPGNENTI